MDNFLENYKLKFNKNNNLIPDSIYYIPEYLNNEEEQQLINEVLNAPKPKWQHLSNRSLLIYGGYPKQNGMIVEMLPEWLQKYTKRLKDIKVFDDNLPNQVLINRYEPGQGIMAHEDGPLYYPTVATINTGQHTVLNFYEKIDSNDPDSSDSSLRKYRFSLLLWPRSLSILKHDAYTRYLHEIEEIKTDYILQEQQQEEKESTKTKQQKLIFINLDKITELNDNLNNNPEYKQNILLNGLKRINTRYSFTIRFVPKCHKLDLSKLLLFRK